MNVKRGFVVGLIIICVIYLSAYIEQRYTRIGTIKRVEPFCYELTDTTNNSFWFYTNDIIKDGTKIKAVLDTKGTADYIYDDEIIDYKIISDSDL